MKKNFFTAGNIARLGMYIALMLILSYTPLGNILLGPIQVTTMHIPVLIGALTGGPMYGLILGATFGLTSMIRAMQGLSGPLSYAFMNPFVSLLPRILFGLVAGYLGQALRKKNIFLSTSLPAFLTTILHTGMVMSSLYFIYGSRISQTQSLSAKAVIGLVLGVCLSNGIPEALFAAFLSTPIVRILKAREKKESNSPDRS